jgi:altronate dehydratase large subunit
MIAGSTNRSFTTGRGTPGIPHRTVIKITGNRQTYLKMKIMWISMSARFYRKGPSQRWKRIFDEMISVASGKLTKAEKLGQRDFCIFKMNPDI